MIVIFLNSYVECLVVHMLKVSYMHVKNFFIYRMNRLSVNVRSCTNIGQGGVAGTSTNPSTTFVIISVKRSAFILHGLVSFRFC